MTAQGRLSAWIVGLSPFVLGLVLQMVAPDFLRPLVTTRAGLWLIVAVVVLVATGLFFVRRIARITL